MTRIWLSLSMLLMLAMPVQAQWTNEPAGSTVVTDWPFSANSGPGWVPYTGTESIVADGSAPLSPSLVGRILFPNGMQAGGYPGAWFFNLPSTTREIYVGFWWRASAGYQQHGSGRTKINFISDAGGNPIFSYMGGGVGGRVIGYQQQPESTVCNGHISGYPGTCGTWDICCSQVIPEGSWAKIELYMKQSSSISSRDGIFRYWVNGVLAREFTTMNFGQTPFNSVPIAPVWGGVGGVKTQEDYFYFDHMRVSIPNCPSPCGNGSPPPPPPSAPPPPPPLPPNKITNLRVQ